VVAHVGIFTFPAAVAAATAGSFVGDCCWYWLGRMRGPKFRAGRIYRRVGPRIEDLARRFGIWELLLARFVYGTKSASMLFWGLQGLPFARFAAVDACGCALGATVFAGLGYLVSDSAAALLGRVRRIELWLLGAVVIGAALVLIIHMTAKRELHIHEGGPSSDS
jgi:membrane protein DedA with SNARE-associated domain